jgi:hypothetical protein
VPQRREIKNLAEEISRKKGRMGQKENFAFPSKLLDGFADQEAKPLRRSTYSSVAETWDRGVLKQTATAKVTTAPNAIRQAGAVTGADDPEAVFWACAIATFEGAVSIPAAGNRASNPNGNPPPGVFVPGKPYTPTEEQLVRIPFGIMNLDRQRFLQDDLGSFNE